MLIIAERINATRKAIGKAVVNRDTEWIIREAKVQAEAGATHIDCNAGRDPAQEVEDLLWIVETVQKAVDLPLSLDSANASALAEALKLVQKTPIINSVTAEKARIAEIMPLAKQYGALLVALCITEHGMPEGTEARCEAAGIIAKAATEYGIPIEHIYFDPLIVPASTKAGEALAAIEAVRRIMKEFPGAHTTCGLSNVSFGLPHRNTVNRAYLAMLMAAGLDGVIMDPTEPHMMSTVLAGRVLTDREEYCMDYIRAGRAGRLD